MQFQYLDMGHSVPAADAQFHLQVLLSFSERGSGRGMPAFWMQTLGRELWECSSLQYNRTFVSDEN
jgi:hypothetical protein